MKATECLILVTVVTNIQVLVLSKCQLLKWGNSCHSYSHLTVLLIVALAQKKNPSLMSRNWDIYVVFFMTLR